MDSKKFNVGDTVEVIDNSGGSKLPIGSVGKITDVDVRVIPPIYLVGTKEGKIGWYFPQEINSIVVSTTATNPLDIQVGGDHYKKYKIQPIEYAMANKLNACQFNAIKYTTRYKDKGGIESLRKAIHSLELLIAFEEKLVGVAQ